MPTDLIEDYHIYASCYEIPRNYIFWSAISLLGACIHKRAQFNVGDIKIHGNLYTMLVGPQGNGKTTSCDFAKQLFIEAYPDLPIGASTQSAEDIVQTMCKDTFPRAFKDNHGESFIASPYAFFMNEFKNFVAYAPSRMLAFLTDIYDRDRFDSSTIKRGAETILNPCLNILACENPAWLVRNLRADVVSGGFSRRVIYVYEIDRPEPVPIVTITPLAEEAKQRVIARLKAIKPFYGEYKWHPSGQKFFIPWYSHKQKNIPDNPLHGGYVGTKHIQLFKVAMLLDFVSDKPMFLFTDELLLRALVFLDPLEENMPKLSLAAGRNELSQGQQIILQFLKDSGGKAPETLIKRKVEQELTWSETSNVLRHLEETEQVVVLNHEDSKGKIKRYYHLREEVDKNPPKLVNPKKPPTDSA